MSPTQAADWYKAWGERLKGRVEELVLLGGEPTLNIQLSSHLIVARDAWREARIIIITNGSFLNRHPLLPVAMRSAGNCLIEITRHHDDEDYLEEFEESLKLLLQWRRDYQISFKIVDVTKRWTRRYKEEGGLVKPFQDQYPRQSWEKCPCRTCFQLHEGKLWKCPIMAYLGLVKNLSPEWFPYLKYKPLEVDCSKEELEEFLKREDEWVCGACPKEPERFLKSNPT